MWDHEVESQILICPSAMGPQWLSIMEHMPWGTARRGTTSRDVSFIWEFSWLGISPPHVHGTITSHFSIHIRKHCLPSIHPKALPPVFNRLDCLTMPLLPQSSQFLCGCRMKDTVMPVLIMIRQRMAKMPRCPLFFFSFLGVRRTMPHVVQCYEVVVCFLHQVVERSDLLPWKWIIKRQMSSFIFLVPSIKLTSTFWHPGANPQLPCPLYVQ